MYYLIEPGLVINGKCDPKCRTIMQPLYGVPYPIPI